MLTKYDILAVMNDRLLDAIHEVAAELDPDVIADLNERAATEEESELWVEEGADAVGMLYDAHAKLEDIKMRLKPQQDEERVS